MAISATNAYLKLLYLWRCATYDRCDIEWDIGYYCGLIWRDMMPALDLNNLNDDDLAEALKHARCATCGTTSGTFVSLTRCWPCDRETPS
jgi:hypothetical protein